MNATTARSQLDRVTEDNAFSTPGQLVAQLPVSPLTDPETGDLNSNTLYPSGLFDAKYNSNKPVALLFPHQWKRICELPGSFLLALIPF